MVGPPQPSPPACQAQPPGSAHRAHGRPQRTQERDTQEGLIGVFDEEAAASAPIPDTISKGIVGIIAVVVYQRVRRPMLTQEAHREELFPGQVEAVKEAGQVGRRHPGLAQLGQGRMGIEDGGIGQVEVDPLGKERVMG